MLLEGIAKSALAYDREVYGEFRETLQRHATTLVATEDAEQQLAVAGAATQALESYNRGAQRVQAAQTVELRCMIEMLSQTLVALAQAGGQSVHALQAIRTQVDGARQLDDIRILRARLGDIYRETTLAYLASGQSAANLFADDPEILRLVPRPSHPGAWHLGV